MPKELTHLIVAETARQNICAKPHPSMPGRLFGEVEDYYRFGAVMHDVAFCASSSPDGETVKERAMAIHGNPVGDTFQPFKNLAGVYDRTGRADILALICGASTHMITDYVFHPFVYYYTGENIARHYKLETLIDTHLYRNQGNWIQTPVSTRRLYKNLKQSLDNLSSHLLVFLGLGDPYKKEILKALNLHALTLKLFRSRPCFHLFRLVSTLGSGEFKSKANLFYPKGMTIDAPFFKKDFEYRHPVTGEPKTGRLDQLVDTAVRRSVEMIEGIQTASAARSLETFFSELEPISLETGLKPDKGRNFHYTDLSVPVERLVCLR